MKYLIPRIDSNFMSSSTAKAYDSPPILTGRDSITPRVAHFLVSHYTMHIFPTYSLPLVDSHINNSDLILDTTSQIKRSKALLACALAALHLSYQRAEWAVTARVCREWASELAVFIYSSATQDALVTVVAFLLYEVVEPSRGMIWALYDFATQLCLQLGWHSFGDFDKPPSVQSPGTACLIDPSNSQTQAQILSVLQSIHRYLRTACYSALFI